MKLGIRHPPEREKEGGEARSEHRRIGNKKSIGPKLFPMGFEEGEEVR
jgi:hypothetical protein